MRQALVAGNWKMHGSLASIKSLLAELCAPQHAVNDVEMVVFPPYVYLPYVAQLLATSKISWGAQNMAAAASGAFTGEVAPSMLNDFECQYVLIGHSERRMLYHEDDIVIAKKFSLALEYGLTPILCVGETLAQREAGETHAVIERQVEAILATQPYAHALADAVIAYEPVWAIGTGKTASPEEAQAVHAAIRQQVAAQSSVVAGQLRIVYGGSVNAANAKELFNQADIDGGLVGGASLDAQQFLTICRAITAG